ncbi:hypothetical protein [Streptomyces sp. NPDC093093]|uniref:hypothetical protein n=1 Tax=Streptomyces sp. NPDC093093 TaxID=3366025 RepID=UPI00382D7934
MTATVLVGQDLVEDDRPDGRPVIVLDTSAIEAGDTYVADDQVFIVLPAVVPELDLHLLVVSSDAADVLDLQILHAPLAGEVVVLWRSGECPGPGWQIVSQRRQTLQVSSRGYDARQVADLCIQIDVFHRPSFPLAALLADEWSHDFHAVGREFHAAVLGAGLRLGLVPTLWCAGRVQASPVARTVWTTQGPHDAPAGVRRGYDVDQDYDGLAAKTPRTHARAKRT